MASQIDNPPKRPVSATAAASARQAAKVKNYVNQQLEKTRTQVKIVDLIAGVLVLIAFVIGFLILAAFIDAWVWPFSTFARWVCLGLLIAGCIAYTSLAIVPLLLKRINPDYAAKMIEEVKPSFRNSLINYVSFRKRPEEINPAVFDAVSRQAATDLASVPGDTSVDRTKLIRIGFVLVGLTLLAVGYKMLSPKDPLQTAARIFAPSEKIAKPAVVKIMDVEPGDTRIFFGEQLNVAAQVRGSHRPEDVRLIYSTLDGQLIDQSVPMLPDGAPHSYRAELSMAGGGIQSSLRYRVTARDGSSPDYEVIVEPNPSIAIESLVFSPPVYTRLAERTLVGVGDIEAIEGTRVTVHALANLPIKVAYIELLNENIDPNQPLADISYEARYKTATTPIEMQSEGKSATGRFQLTLNSSRERPVATHYRVKFVSQDDHRNVKPNVYPIRVVPDLAPEIRMRNPVQPDVEVPVNGALAIDIEANDLDFEIKSVSLKLDRMGNQLLDQKLQLSSSDGNRRVTARYLLRPSELGLKPGDKAVFFGTAADNRISPFSDQPDPNISWTENFSLTVTDKDKEAEQPNQNDQPDPNKKDESVEKGPGDTGESDTGEGETGEGKTGQESGGNSQQSESGGGESSESETGEGETEEGQTGEGQTGEGQTGEGQTGEGQTGEGQTGEGQTGESGSNPPEGGDPGSQSSGDENNQGDQAGSQNPGDPAGNDSQNANQQDGNESTNDSQTPDGGDPGQQDSSGGGQPDSGKTDGSNLNSDGSEGQQDESLSNGSIEQLSRNASEAERMRKAEEHFKENEQQSPDGSESSEQSGGQANENQEDGSNSSDGSDSGSDQNPNAQAGDATAQPNESESDPSNKTGEGSSQGEREQGSQGKEHEDFNPGKADEDNNNQNSGEASSKSGMEDATGKPTQNSGDGKESEQTGNEGGGTDAGQADSGEKGGGEKGDSGQPEQTGSDGNDSGKPDSGQPNSDPQGKQPGDPQSGGEQPQGGGEQAQGGGEQPQGGGEQPQGGGEQPQGGGEQPQGGGEQPQGGGEQPQSGGEQPQGGGEQAQGGGEQPQGGGEQSRGGGEQSQGGGEQPQGGGEQSRGSGQASDNGFGGGDGSGDAPGEMLEREKTNLEHAKKATDMVLSKLADQQHDPDPDLLKKMNMSKQELQDFVRRWEEMKRAAETGDPMAKRKYERSLKSLDLRPKGARRAVAQNQDDVTGLSEDSAVNRPPPERVPDFNSFIRDLNRVGDK